MYVLTQANGHVIEFYLESCAEIFKQCWGGDIEYVERIIPEDIEIY
jgi:hypothetical protein